MRCRVRPQFSRKLCGRTTFEEDPEKVIEMLKLLIAIVIVHEDNEEVWTRMTMLDSEYGLTFSKARS